MAVVTDVRWVEPNLPETWPLLWASHGGHDTPGCIDIACELVCAFGETRQLPALLSSLVVALRDQHKGCTARHVLCEPRLAAAWVASTANMSPTQSTGMLRCVGDCLHTAVAAFKVDCSSCMLSVLNEPLSAIISGIGVTPETAKAVALASAHLETCIDELLQHALAASDNFGPEFEYAFDGVAALLRLCCVNASLQHESARQATEDAPCPERGAGLVAARHAADTRSVLPRATPWLKLEAARVALSVADAELEYTQTIHLSSSSAASVVRVLCFPLVQDGLNQSSQPQWDGVASTVSEATLPCALWQLATERVAVWCEAASPSALDIFLRIVLRGALAMGRPVTNLVTVTGCSCALLADAAFYELHATRDAMPPVLLDALDCATRETQQAVGGRWTEVARLAACTDDFPAFQLYPRAHAQDDKVLAAVFCAARTVELMTMFPVTYLRTQHATAVLLKVLQLEKLLFCSLLVTCASCVDPLIDLMTACRGVVTKLLHSLLPSSRAALLDVPWLLRSMDVVVGSHESLSHPQINDVAASTASLLLTLLTRTSLSSANVNVDMVFALVCSSSDNLCVPAPPSVHLVALTRMLLLEIILTALSSNGVLDLSPSGLHALRETQVDSLNALTTLCGASSCSPCEDNMYTRKRTALFGILAASFQLAAQPVTCDVRLSLLSGLCCAATQHLLHDPSSQNSDQLLRFLHAAFQVSAARKKLLAPTILAVRAVFMNLLVMRSTVLPGTVLDVFGQLARVAGPELFEALLFGLSATQLDSQASIDTLTASFQLLNVILSVSLQLRGGDAGERCFVAVESACATLAASDARFQPSAARASSAALRVVGTLLSSRKAFPLRSSSVGRALLLPATVFADMQANVSPDMVPLFTCCCDLLTAALHDRPQAIRRCMPLLVQSITALFTAFFCCLQTEHARNESSIHMSTLLEAASTGGVHGKYLAAILADFITVAVTTPADTLSSPLQDGLHALLGACSPFEQQQVHVALAAGHGGTRQLILSSLRDEREQTRFRGTV